MSEKKSYHLAFLTVMCIFIMGQCPGSIDAAISKIADHFSLSSTTALYVTTIASLVCVISSIIVGFLAGRKIPFRMMVLCCGGVELLGSLLPFFTDHFIVILLFRAIFGIGIGGMMSLENTIAVLIILEKKRAVVLGTAMFCGFGGNCLLRLVGGLLADIGWNYVFLTHLMLVIPFGFLLFGCPPIESVIRRDQEKVERIAPVVWGLCLVMALVGLMISPLLIGCSFLSAAIIDSATVAGIVAVCFSVGCMVGGLFFSFLYQLSKRYSISVALIIAAVGVIGSAVAPSIFMLCSFIFIGGLGFVLTQTSVMMAVGRISSPRTVALSSSLLMAFFNFGMFFSSQFEALIGDVTGDALYVPLYLGAVVYLLIAAVLALINPFPLKIAQNLNNNKIYTDIPGK